MFRFAIFALTMLTAAGVDAATRYTSTTEIPAESRTATTTMLIDSSRMRIDAQDGDMIVIFDGDRSTMTLVDPQERTFMVLDKAAIEELAGQVSQAMEQMEQALQAMPEAQRQQMKQMMEQQLGNLGGQEPLPAPEVKELGTTDSVGGHACRWKAVERGGALVSKLCVGDWDDMPGGDEMMSLQRKMAEFAESLQEAFTKGGPPMLTQAFQDDTVEAVTLTGGFPLITERYSGSTMMERSTFTGAENVSASDADFAPPVGYTEQPMGLGASPMGRRPQR